MFANIAPNWIPNLQLHVPYSQIISLSYEGTANACICNTLVFAGLHIETEVFRIAKTPSMGDYVA